MGLYLAVGPALPGRSRDLSGPANLTETTSRCGARLASFIETLHTACTTMREYEK